MALRDISFILPLANATGLPKTVRRVGKVKINCVMKKCVVWICILCAFSIPVFAGNLIAVVPQNHHAREPSSKYLIDIYKGLDPRVLRSNDSVLIDNYFRLKNQEIVSYIKNRYGEDLSLTFSINNPMLTIAGLFVACFEIDTDPNAPRFAPGIGDCLIEAVGVAVGVNDIISSYNSLVQNGASFNSIFKLVKNFVKRYVGWFMAGIAIYEFGDCMNWW